MELIYLYIENDERNIQECQFNFSPRYDCYYKKDSNELTINENNDYVNNFWNASNISNITAIIGKNGTGKSNLIQFLLEHYEKKNTIYIYKIDKKLKIETNIPQLKTDKNFNHEFIEESRVICYPAIYYNPNIYQNISIDFFREKASIDISEKRIVIVDSEKFIREDSHYANNIWHYHKYGNTLRQLDFLSKYSNWEINDLRLPKKCFIRCEFLPVFNHIPYNSDAKDFYNRLKTECKHAYIKDKDTQDTHVLNLFPLYATLIYELYCYCHDMGISFDWNDYYFDTIVDAFMKKCDSKIGQLLLDIDAIIRQVYFEYDERNHGFYASIDRVKNLFSKYFELISVYRNNISKKVSNKTEAFIPPKSLFYSMITVEWEHNMSSGEQMYLNLMSSLYYAKEQMDLQPKISNIFLLLDEPEISFHPEWQRQFKYLNRLYYKCF
ncbi:MAG: ATP-binding protein [Bacteroidales bacterium]|jgi:hypothetical protein|nr:ATP-binding protein [Bacteroidales bacterium]